MLPKATRRELKHTRVITGTSYLRVDGLWDIEVFLSDKKSFTFDNRYRDYIAAGETLHDMALRITINANKEIVNVDAEINASPFAACPNALTNCQKLVGVRVAKGFNKKTIELLSGINGCRHMTDMFAYAANVVFQSVATKDLNNSNENKVMSFEKIQRIKRMYTNSCYAFSEGGEVLNQYENKMLKQLKSESNQKNN